ncbi:MAG TPA: phenylacetate-CoA oxygenase subunit PaaC [Ignavibacteria bacterium]|nr:phenylacetate-CoA oxygenase subunit PaaC [Ignavibacteria bacterium]HRK00894.1 phenylacetate-CoA oxygenase subunit PaaC [Ignavibacteria bacterium]
MKEIIDFNEIKTEAIKNLLYRLADDQLILGHRNSEWTGLGPILEEDIAFSSMAQDKLGHSQALYQLLHSMGEKDPDTIAFTRKVNEYLCCHLVEYPIGEYDFSLMRHFLFDMSEAIRFNMLSSSSFEPLAKIAKKFKGELKYHTMHAVTWINQLGAGSEESASRIQKSLDKCFPLALGIFEPSKYEETLISEKIFFGEKALQEKWLEAVIPVLKNAGLKIPLLENVKAAYGGREGVHTEYLKPLIDEMTEVYKIDSGAEW